MQRQESGVRVALVSGCSSGIGRLTARTLAAAGWTVYAGLHTVPAHQSAAQLAGAAVRTLPLDVTDPAQIRAAIKRIEGESGRLDALVNNAGIDSVAAVEDQTEHDLRAVMEVNFFGALALTRAALPLMRTQDRSVIVMISSLSGLLGLPGSSAYCASKFALEGASESLRNEVGRFGIGVALIEPGGYATAMGAKRRLPANYPIASAYRPMVEQLVHANQASADPIAVAELVRFVIEAGAPQLRYAAGAQAEQVVAHLATLDDAARQRYARAVTDLEWWDAGASHP
jgi:NAD(P)-dependent dehydrogenase (short-subunit alcohol dehydrogenase family)